MRLLISLLGLAILTGCAATERRFTAELTRVIGTYDVDSYFDGASFDDDTDAQLTRARIEYYGPKGFGFGFSADVTMTNNDLTSNDGEVDDLTAFLYAGYELPTFFSQLRIPVKLGLGYLDHCLDVTNTSEELTTDGLAYFVEASPQFRVLGDEGGLQIWAFADVRVGMMNSDVDWDGGTPTDYTSDTLLWSLHGGLKAKYKVFSLSAGYLANKIDVEKDSAGLLSDTEYLMTGFALGVGIEF